MKLRIHYEAAYCYEEAVSFSTHVMRIFPKAAHDRVIERCDFETNAAANVQFRRDIFDNDVAICFYPERDRELRVRLELQLEVQERNAFGFLLASRAVDFPFQYTNEELRVLRPYIDGSAPVELPFWRPEPQPTVSFLVGLNQAIHENIRYQRRDEGAAWTPSETLANGAAACRDFAVLQTETLRGLGIAARMASGYLCEIGEEEKRAEGAMHAWVEAYLPGAGWTGLDPTNGTFCNHNHLTAAVGLGPEDVSPISGNYYAAGHVPSRMSSSLQMEAL